MKITKDNKYTSIACFKRPNRVIQLFETGYFADNEDAEWEPDEMPMWR